MTISVEERRKRQRAQKRRKAIAAVAFAEAWKPPSGECLHGHAAEHRRRCPGGSTYCNECANESRRRWRDRQRQRDKAGSTRRPEAARSGG